MMDGEVSSMTRRELLRSAFGHSGGGGTGSAGDGGQDKAGAAEKSKAFPKKFMWGCATAAYQVEGNSINTDLWLMSTCRGRFLRNLRATHAITNDPSTLTAAAYRQQLLFGPVVRFGWHDFRRAVETRPKIGL
jgi:hypothetical protein